MEQRYTRNRPHGQVLPGLVFITTVVCLGGVGFVTAPTTSQPKEHSFTVKARQYGYTPEVIRVNKGDTVRLRFTSEDVVHGFFLEGHDLDVTIVPLRSEVELRRPSEAGKSEMVEEVRFKADREGKFRYRCSQTCGFMHPFMLGELIVGPNRLLPTSLGLVVGVLLGGLFAVILKARSKP